MDHHESNSILKFEFDSQIENFESNRLWNPTHTHLKTFLINFHYHASLYHTAYYVIRSILVIMHILFEIKNPTAFSATGQTMIGNLASENLRKNLLLAKLP